MTDDTFKITQKYDVVRDDYMATFKQSDLEVSEPYIENKSPIYCTTIDYDTIYVVDSTGVAFRSEQQCRAYCDEMNKYVGSDNFYTFSEIQLR